MVDIVDGSSNAISGRQQSQDESFANSMKSAKKKSDNAVMLPEEAGVDNWVELNPSKAGATQSPNWVEQSPPQLAKQAGGQPEITKEQTEGIAKAVDKLSKRLGENKKSVDGLSKAEQELAKSDSINLAVVQELNIDINPEREDLSVTEKSIAKEKPLVFAMLQHNGVEIKTNDFGASVVTYNGNKIELSDVQKHLLSSGNISDFSTSLLGNIEANENTQYLLAASGMIRPGYTKAEADELVQKGEPEKAREVVKKSLDNALIPSQREAVWELVGKDHFTADYIRTQIQEQRDKGFDDLNAMYHAGEWMKEASQNLPSEAAAVALDVVMEDFSKDWIEGKKNKRGGIIGASDGRTLYAGISSLVEAAPQQSQKVAEWLVNPDSAGHALYAKIEREDFDYVVKTAKDGNGVQLAYAMHEIMTAEEAKTGGSFKVMTAGFSLPDTSVVEELGEKLEEAQQEDLKIYGGKISSGVYASFIENLDVNIQARFDHLVGHEGIGQETDYMYMHNRLKNIIGMAMGFEPSDKMSALADDHTRSWYSQNLPENDQIELVAHWMAQEGKGGDFKFKINPFIYASEKAGVSNGALIELTKSNGEKIIIDASMADDVLAEHDGDFNEAKRNTQLNYIYDNTEDFFDDNYLDPDGKLYMAKGGQLADADNDGHVDIESVKAANVTAYETWSPWVMAGVGAVGFVGGLALSIPSMGTSLGISGLSAGLMTGGAMVLGTGYAVDQLIDMDGHGRDIWTLRNEETRGAWLNLAGSALAVGALGMGARATMLATGAKKVADVGTVAAVNQARVMSARSLQWAATARNSGHAGAALGVAQMGDAAQQTIRHWDQMSTQDKLLAVFDTGMGMADLGVGIYAGRHEKTIQARATQRNKESATAIYEVMRAEKRSGRPRKPVVVGKVENWEAETTLFIPNDGSQPTVMRVVTDPVSGNKTLVPESEWRGPRRKKDSGEFLIEVSEAENGTQVKAEETSGADRTIYTVDEENGHLNEARYDDDIELMSREDYFPVPRDPSKPMDPAFEAVTPQSVEQRPIGWRRKMDDAVGDFLRKFLMEIKSSETLYEKYRTRVLKHVKQRKPLENENFDPRKTPENATLFRPDDKTAIMAAMPGGLRHLVHDVHVHSMGYDRRTGNWLISLSYRAGRNSRIVSGSIPQFCGPEHYLNPNPNIAILDLAQQLDQRALDDFHELLTTDIIRARLHSDDGNDQFLEIPGRYLAAKIDLSLTGLDFSKAGTQDPVAYAKGMMLENPGMFNIIGEVTGVKEHVSNLLGPSAWDMSSPKFREYLGFANETGQAILLHYDWGKPAIGKDGRTQAVKMDYSNLDEIISTLGATDQDGNRIYADTNIIMAHTGIGRYVRPNDQPVKKMVTVRDLQGKVIDQRMVEAPEHIHRLYEFFDKVPNARADISWNDVAQAYSDSPALREGIIQFVVDNQDRLIWGSDSVKPETRAHYNQALNSSKRLMVDIALKDPNALRKLVRGNYETILGDAQYRVDKWTQRQLVKEHGKKEAKVHVQNLYHMREGLNYYRHEMNKGAERDFQLWLHRVETLARQGKFDVNENPGMFPMLFESLSDAHRMEAGHGHDHDHTADRGGVGSSGGKRQNDPDIRKQFKKDAAIIGGLALTGAGALSTVMGGPAGDALNGAAFATRSIFATQRAEVVERFRQYAKNIFGRRGQGTDFKIDKEQIDLLCTLIDDNAAALQLSDEQILRSLTAVQQFWVNYQQIKGQKLDNRNGFTEWQKHHAIISMVGELQITLARELRMEVNFIDPMDARTRRGFRYNAGLILPTLAVNEAASIAWLHEVFGDNPPDLTTPEGAAETAFKGLFFAGNSVMAGRITALAAAGKNKVSIVNSQLMKQMQRLESYLYTAAGASWTLVDAMNALHILDDVPDANSASLRAATAATKVLLDGAFTYAMAQSAKDTDNALSGNPMRDPHDMHNTKMLLLGALAFRTAMLAGEGLMDLKEKWDQEEELVNAAKIKEAEDQVKVPEQ